MRHPNQAHERTSLRFNTRIRTRCEPDNASTICRYLFRYTHPRRMRYQSERLYPYQRCFNTRIRVGWD
jgi:hypothetical protein